MYQSKKARAQDIVQMVALIFAIIVVLIELFSHNADFWVTSGYLPKCIFVLATGIIGAFIGFFVVFKTEGSDGKIRFEAALKVDEWCTILLLFAGFAVAGLVGILLYLPLAEFLEKDPPIFVPVLITILALAAGSCWTIRTTNVHQRYMAERNMATYVVLHNSAGDAQTKTKYLQIVKFWAKACESYLKASAHLSFMTLYLVFSVILLFGVVLFTVLDTRLLALAEVILFILALECGGLALLSLILFRRVPKLGWFSKLSTRLCNSFPVLKVKDIGLSEDIQTVIYDSPWPRGPFKPFELHVSYSERMPEIKRIPKIDSSPEVG